MGKALQASYPVPVTGLVIIFMNDKSYKSKFCIKPLLIAHISVTTY